MVGDPFPGHNRFQGMLAIPYLSPTGQPLSIRFRCLTEGCSHDYHGKYNTVKGDHPRMYGMHQIATAREEIHLCEGELDSIILNKLGLPAVAVPGAEMFLGRHRRLLAGFNRVWVWADPDDAGADLLNKVTRQLRQAKGIRLKADVTDTYLAGGREAVFAALGREMGAAA